MLVVEIYLERNPAAFANQLVHHYGLNAQTAELIRSVLVQELVGAAVLSPVLTERRALRAASQEAA